MSPRHVPLGLDKTIYWDIGALLIKTRSLKITARVITMDKMSEVIIQNIEPLS